MTYTLADLALDLILGLSIIGGALLLCLLAAVLFGGKGRGLFVLLLLLPATSHAQEVRFVYPAFVTAQIADLHSTHVALKAGAREMNPLMVHPAVRYPIKTLMTLAVLASAEKNRVSHPQRTFWIVTAITAAQFTVDYFNYRHAGNLRRGK